MRSSPTFIPRMRPLNPDGQMMISDRMHLLRSWVSQEGKASRGEDGDIEMRLEAPTRNLDISENTQKVLDISTRPQFSSVQFSSVQFSSVQFG